ncbi:MAG: hypothetical protein AAF801_00125, partial [Pseudomonadota bacterium]
FSAILGMSDVTDAKDLQLFDGSQASIATTKSAFDAHFTDAQDPNTGDFLFPLIGVINDPFVA